MNEQISLLIRHMEAVKRGDQKEAEKIRKEAEKKGYIITFSSSDGKL